MSETVLVERRGGVALLTMNLPAKRNALAAELLPVLSQRLTESQSTLSAMTTSSGRSSSDNMTSSVSTWSSVRG